MFLKSEKTSTSTKAKTARNASAAPSIIAADVRLQGNLDSGGEVHLDGTLDGDIRCAALTVGDGGHITGAVMADWIVVRGAIDGEVRANTVKLEKSAHLKGDIWHQTISIEAGAFIEGRLVHTDKPHEKTETTVCKPVALALNGSGKHVADTERPEKENNLFGS